MHMDKRSKVLDSPRKIADILKAAAGQNLDVTCKVVETG